MGFPEGRGYSLGAAPTATATYPACARTDPSAGEQPIHPLSLPATTRDTECEQSERLLLLSVAIFTHNSRSLHPIYAASTDTIPPMASTAASQLSPNAANAEHLPIAPTTTDPRIHV